MYTVRIIYRVNFIVLVFGTVINFIKFSKASSPPLSRKGGKSVEIFLDFFVERVIIEIEPKLIGKSDDRNRFITGSIGLTIRYRTAYYKAPSWLLSN